MPKCDMSNSSLLRFLALWCVLGLCVIINLSTYAYQQVYFALAAMALAALGFTIGDPLCVVSLAGAIDLEKLDDFFEDDPFCYFFWRVLFGVIFFAFLLPIIPIIMSARDVATKSEARRREAEEMIKHGPPRAFKPLEGNDWMDEH